MRKIALLAAAAALILLAVGAVFLSRRNPLPAPSASVAGAPASGAWDDHLDPALSDLNAVE